MTIADCLASVRERMAAACQRCGRSAGELRLIAVTKTQEPAVLAELQAGGISDFGENRLEHHQLMHASAPAGSRFHAIGRVQSRYLPQLAPLSVSLHSLCQVSHVPRLARACTGRRLPVFCQVNSSGEAAKAGVRPEELSELLDAVRAEESLELLGLMCMAPDLGLPDVQEGDVRRCFADLRMLAEQHGLSRLSMGMSGDFEIAIEEGATDLRLGSVLFQ